MSKSLLSAHFKYKELQEQMYSKHRSQVRRVIPHMMCQDAIRFCLLDLIESVTTVF